MNLLLFSTFLPLILCYCPDGFDFSKKFNKCYQVNTALQTFVGSEEFCETIDANLVDIQSKEENEHVEDLIRTSFHTFSSYWIGANLLLSLNWTWTTSSAFTYSNWGNDQPADPSPYQCASGSDLNNKWKKVLCNSVLPSVCSVSAEKPRPPDQPCDSICPEYSYCDSGFFLYPGTCKCYMYGSYPETVSGAADYCQNERATLLTGIKDMQHNDFLVSLMSNKLPDGSCGYGYCPWLGLSCSGSTCSWSNGAPVDGFTNFDSIVEGDFQLTNWATFGTWDVSNDTTAGILCEKNSQVYSNPKTTTMSIPEQASHKRCPIGSTYEAFFHRCYKVTHAPSSFLEAEKSCNQIGGNLATVHSAFENSYIVGLVAKTDQETSFWIGANLLLAATWSWTSNSSVSYTNWNQGEPNDPSIYQCAAVQEADRFWRKEMCNSPKPFVCTVEPYAPAPIPRSCNVTCPDHAYCDKGYIYSSVNCKCYMYSAAQKSFNATLDFCQSQNGTLPKITSYEQNDFLVSLMGFYGSMRYYPWIGLTCTSENDCSWSDGSVLTGYSNFAGSPSSYSVLMYYDKFGQWESATTGQESVICEKNPTYMKRSTF